MRKYYMSEEGGGGGEKKKYKDAPEGYVPQTSEQRKKWNDYLDAVNKEGGSNSDGGFLEKYNKENPDKAIDPKTVPFIQYEQKALRSGDSFPGMTDSQLKVFRQQLNPDYVKRDVDSGISKAYYPTLKKGDVDYGTDIDGYVKDNLSGGKGGKNDGDEIIPLPDFKNAKSRGQFTSAYKKKYGDIFKDVPSSIQYAIGDIPLNVNQIPRAAKDTSKNIVQKYGKDYDIDPALLYTSFMAEGGSGLYKSEATGLDTRNRKPGEYGYQAFYGDKDFPVNGPESFGFTTFSDRFPELVKGGYLPKNFENEFRGKKRAGEFGQDDFKSVESAMQGKAALLKFSRDEVDDYAKKHGVELSPKAREFFMLAAFNGGEGGYRKRMLEYKNQGLLEDDKFLKSRPQGEDKVKGTISDVWGHVSPRMRIRDSLKKEKQFENDN